MYRRIKENNFRDPEMVARHKQLKNEVTSIIKKAKRDYIIKEFTESNNDPKRFWKAINFTLRNNQGTNQRNEVLEIINDDQEKITNVEKISDCLNAFFATVEINLANQIHEINITPVHPVNNDIQEKSIFLTPVDVQTL